jgi:1,2-diacylglycerol 3-beta-galactosyltransferase
VHAFGFGIYLTQLSISPSLSVDKCYVPSDALYKAALDRKVKPDQIVEYGLPIRKGFWSERKETDSASTEEKKDKGWFAKTFGGNDDGANEDSPSSGKKGKTELREELGLVQGIPTVLIVGGGDGMGGIVEQADATSDDPSFQMVVVCGKNENAQKQLSADDWGKGVNVDVKGFVYNMDEYMRASDAIVTKAGPGTIAEASICGLPCMLSSYL